MKNFNQRLLNLIHLRGFCTVKQLGNRPNIQKNKDFWMIFLGLNLFTIPLSPMAGGLMSREVYIPIMIGKMAITGVLILTSLYLYLWNKKFLKS